MSEKKGTKKNVSSKAKPIKETKEEYFLRIAKPRVSNVLKALRILSNCSNRNNYSYDQEQVNKMFATITKGLETCIMKFTPSKKESESFEF